MTLYDLVAPGLDTTTEPRYRIAEIRAADPLGADPLLAALPAMNRDADVPALTVALRTLVPDPDRVAEWSIVEALAGMRDIGMLLGSLKRHGTEPAAAVPEILPVLEELARRTDMVPRDTVHHYTTWNPPGRRRRMYTGHEMEAHLQEAVRMVFPSLVAALGTCTGLARLEPYDPGFALALDRTAMHVQAMVDSIDFTVANVSPEYFARTLRPYFEEIDVAGRDYLGPAAAQVPLWPVDLTLWQCDRSNPAYDAFLDESVAYSLPSWRAFHAAHRGGVSAVSKLSAALSWETVHRLPPELIASARSLARVLRILKTFRARHIGIARKAYGDDLRLYDEGSGGAPVALLREVLDLTRDNETLVRRSVEHPRPAAVAAQPVPAVAARLPEAGTPAPAA
ncbi:monodechloroaminopyrrolnitrin synthase PrnB family protein [Streptomyces sp. NPDC013953]|uniref:monodechloroaminopyrrolnitrin synthase PrnB family protein n=1 Tax=Streptomyces sp. NPDC013953 TaxID=3364868 RepID=UPI0036F9DBEA